jgi:glycerol dehydrogenase-like iron-containing ADH family enzyme
MKKDTQALSENVFDVLIVGGGMASAISSTRTSSGCAHPAKNAVLF